MNLTSPYPKVAAIIGALAAILRAVQATVDGDPSTTANWPEAINLIVLAWGLFTARQNNVSSEQAGAK